MLPPAAETEGRGPRRGRGWGQPSALNGRRLGDGGGGAQIVRRGSGGGWMGSQLRGDSNSLCRGRRGDCVLTSVNPLPYTGHRQMGQLLADICLKKKKNPPNESRKLSETSTEQMSEDESFCSPLTPKGRGQCCVQ